MKIVVLKWLILALAIMAVAFLGLGLVHSSQVKEEKLVAGQLAVVSQGLDKFQLNQLYQRRDELESRIARTTSELEAAQNSLCQTLDSIAIADTLYKIARSSDVELTEIESTGLAIDKLQAVTCSVLPMNIRVEGDVPEIIDFITSLSKYFATGVVKNAKISVPESASDNISAEIRLVIYSYEGG